MHRAWEEIYQNINNFSVWNYVFSSTFLYFPNCHARTSYFSDLFITGLQEGGNFFFLNRTLFFKESEEFG